MRKKKEMKSKNLFSLFLSDNWLNRRGWLLAEVNNCHFYFTFSIFPQNKKRRHIEEYDLFSFLLICCDYNRDHRGSLSLFLCKITKKGQGEDTRFFGERKILQDFCNSFFRNEWKVGELGTRKCFTISSIENKIKHGVGKQLTWERHNGYLHSGYPVNSTR